MEMAPNAWNDDIEAFSPLMRGLQRVSPIFDIIISPVIGSPYYEVWLVSWRVVCGEGRHLGAESRATA